MKALQILSDKDLQQIKVTYRTVIQNFYENPSEQNTSSILLLNTLTSQTISTRQQSDSLLLISVLEILKVKAKSNKELSDSIQNTIIHLKNPLKIQLKDAVVLECLERMEIYPMCCTIINRLYEHQLKPKAESYNWKEIITKVSKNSDKNMSVALQTIITLLPNYPSYAKQVSKSGIVKYICSVYLPQVLQSQDKSSLYRSLKVLKLIAQNDRSLLPGREKNIALAIYKYPTYIFIVQEIIQGCMDQDYALKILGNPKDIDPIYLWSHSSKFCNLSSQSTIDALQNMLKQSGKAIPVELEWKIYATINNLCMAKNFRIKQSWRIPINAEKNINAYLKMVLTNVQKNPQEFYKYVDLKAIQYVNDRSKSSDTVTEKLIKDLKNLDPANSGKKIGKLQSSILQNFSVDKNPQILMQKAAKPPRNNDQLQIIQQILTLKSKTTDELQNDIIKTLKNKAIDSLKTAVTLKYPINLAQVFNHLNLDAMDPEILNKLIKLGELYLTRDPDQSSKFNTNKFLQIMQWLQDNHGIAIIDWVAAGQMLSIIFGPDEWKKHLQQLPTRSFWLLNSIDCQLTQSLLTKLNSLPPNHPKIPIILGFISKNGDPVLKKHLLKTKVLDTVVSDVCGYKSVRGSVKSVKDGQVTEGEAMKKHLSNVLNLSYYIYNWKTLQFHKQIQSKIITPCLQTISQHFYNTEQQLRFIENSLPHTLPLTELKNLNLQKLLETHGKLTSYLHNNKYKGKIDFGKISTIGTEVDPIKIEEILKFLEHNPGMIQGGDLVGLLDGMLSNAKRGCKYWKFYPHYMSILYHIADIATKSDNPQILQKLTQILQKLINGTAQNQDITPEQLDQLYQNIDKGLQNLIKRKVRIDAKRLKIQAQKVQNPEWKKSIMEKIKILGEIKAEAVKAEAVRTQKVKIMIQPDSYDHKTDYVGNKYQGVPVNIVTNTPKGLSTTKTQQIRVDPSTIKQNYDLNASKLSISSLQVNLHPSDDQKKDQNILTGVDTIQLLKKQQQQPQSPDQQRLLDALKLLRKIVQKQQPKQTFPRLVEIFMVSEFNKNRRYVLGHLLTEYYEGIERDARVVALLQLKEKTNLSKEVCYKFLSKYEEVFVISKRWKLMGNQFMELAMERVKCNNQNKTVCIQNGCQIAQYNLLKNPDILHFYQKKYHQSVVQLFPRVTQKLQAMYYLLLIGTSARLPEIKTIYINNKFHTQLLKYTKTKDWISDQRISANLSYAISSLVYTQNHIAIEVASKKDEMVRLMQSYREFATKKPVVESGCSLLSNICYSNKQTKQLLYNYGIAQLLRQLLSQNLQKPEVSTHKQIMRALGNISLHKGCAQRLIENKICFLIIQMIQKFNILIYRDDQKLKVLKLTVDFFSNLASHKFKLEKMHEEGVTNFVITILETTEISEDQVLMACIDTIDGLCQSQLIENYVVMDKKLLLQLIDLLKVKQDQKVITKSIRLLTNMTLNQTCIPYILQANLLSVLANIVLSVYRNPKIDLYINKIFIRIYQRKPEMKLVLKSGYLDCLMKSIEINDQVDDNYIDILLHYCQYIPNYLNHRAFFGLVKVLTTKQNQKEIVDKCFRVIRVIFSSEEKEDEDILIEGSSAMYDKLLTNNSINKVDVVYLIGLHCTKSKKFRKQLILDHASKKTSTIDTILKMLSDEQTRELAFSVMFAIMNKDKLLVDVGEEIVKEEDFAYKLLTKGFQCKLFRMDGSSKSAVVDINEMYMIRAYKYPDGEVKKKYVISIRQLRDWQFFFEPNDQAWRTSVFSKQKGMFESKPKIQNCLTLLGSQQWGQFSLINLQFNDTASKLQFVKAISALVLSFKQ